MFSQSYRCHSILNRSYRFFLKLYHSKPFSTAVKLLVLMKDINILNHDGQYFVNSSKFRDIPITAERIAKRNLKELSGIDPRSVKDTLFSLHIVKHVEDAFVCSCKSFWVSGIMCSHICAIMHVTNEFDYSLSLNMIEQPSKRGRKKNRTSALQRG